MVGEKEFTFAFLHPLTNMELLHHLGIAPEPNPTLRSIYHKAKGIFVLYILFRILLWYHAILAVCSVSAVFVPNLAAQIKRQCAEWFWTTVMYFIVCKKRAI